MRNLKKILALVLALVMSISVMSVASAEFKDADKVNEKFAEAVEVLNGLRVFKGYEDGTFNPTGAITRAEVAAIIYRIDTGDVDGKQANIYADYGKFDDVKSTAWYAGYVNYCANALYIRGYDEHTFGPNDKVTGYQALAMILRAVGYDKNGEFSGSAWQIETAKYAQRLGITANVDVNTLGIPATRELVANLLYRTVMLVPQVRYNLVIGYEPTAYGTINAERFQINFEDGSRDEWGRPTYYVSAVLYGKREAIIDRPVGLLATYTDSVDECVIVAETGIKGEVNWYDNGNYSKKVTIEAEHHTNNHIHGGCGTLIEVYADGTIVEIDTYLAEVTAVVEPKFDKKGHQYNVNYDEFTICEDGETFQVKGNAYEEDAYYLVYIHNAKDAKGNITRTLKNITVPTSVDAKQTKIWWNAAQHTIAGELFSDNEHYAPDAAKRDREDAYTWFFDHYNNVIGSIVIPEDPEMKNYAIVLDVQWINGIGVKGYASATVQYLNGEIVEGVEIAKVNGITMKYAGTMPDFDPTTGEIINAKSFNDGWAYTTWQYNLDTAAHLYEVTEKDGVLSLETRAAKTDIEEIAEGAIADGVSKIADGIYANNKTTFFFYNEKTGVADMYVGYDNLPYEDATAYDFDYVKNADNRYAQYIYVYELVEAEEEQKPTAEKFDTKYVYITGDSYNYELGNKFGLFNLFDETGADLDLYFSKTFAGTEADTEAFLEDMIALYTDMLLTVEVSKTTGLVRPGSVKVVALTDWTAKGTTMYAAAGTFEYDEDEDAGVLFFEYAAGTADDVALNVNGVDETIFIKDGKEIAKVSKDELEGSNLYIIYKGTTAKVIFITSTTAADIADATEVMALSVFAMVDATDFNDVAKSFTYELGKDTIVTVAEAVKAGSFAEMSKVLLADAITVEVTALELKDEVVNEKTVTYAYATVVVTFEDKTETITLKLNTKAAK